MTGNVTRNEAADRFEATIDGILCLLDYHLDADVLTITHTRVPDAVGGRGIAGELTKAAFDTARREHWKVKPACSYAFAWVARHPEYRNLVSGN